MVQAVISDRHRSTDDRAGSHGACSEDPARDPAAV